METNTTRSGNRIRLSLEVSPEANKRLEELAEELATSKSEVLRKAVTLISVAVEAKQHGKKLYLSEHAPAGTSQEIIGI